jgi:4'-phosphopantetheinyl transferase
MSAAEQLWNRAPTDLKLSSQEVHVWRASLDLPDVVVNRFRQLLTPNERDRAERFSQDRDKSAFIVARGVLRVILSGYLHAPPGELRFCTNDFGKPFLTGPPSTNEIRFNVSHSSGLAVYAVTCGRDLGIDLERVNLELATDEIANCFFSPRELTADRTLPADRREVAFFRRWTGKEAYIKGLGKGLSLPLDQFDVLLNPTAEVMYLHTRERPPGSSNWSLVELHPSPGYVGSLAVEGQGWSLSCWDWGQSWA